MVKIGDGHLRPSAGGYDETLWELYVVRVRCRIADTIRATQAISAIATRRIIERSSETLAYANDTSIPLRVTATTAGLNVTGNTGA